MSTPIEEGNKIIAEFMGREPHNWHPNHERRDYDNSWNYLMPVVDKILFETGSSHAQWDAKIISSLSTVSLENLWQITVQFIQWFNQQNKVV